MARKARFFSWLFVLSAVCLFGVAAWAADAVSPADPQEDLCPVGRFQAWAPEYWRAGVPVPFGSYLYGEANCTAEAIYDWDFGDGSPHGSGPKPTYVYDQAKSYHWSCLMTIHGRTIGDAGYIDMTDTVSWKYRVDCVPHDGIAPLEVTCYALLDPKCADYGADWILGDGSTGSGTEVKHTYLSPGTYTVKVTVGSFHEYWQKCEVASSWSRHIWAYDWVCAIPSCEVTVPTTASLGPQPISFWFATPTDPAGCGGDRISVWDLGDGTISTNDSAYHKYEFPGTYHWSHTWAYPAYNQSCKDEGDIVVTACNLQCETTVPKEAGVGQDILLEANVVRNDCTGLLYLAWDFGDESPSGNQYRQHHTYAKNGEYTWKLRVTTDNGICVKTGKIIVGCVNVGKLQICADQMAKVAGGYRFEGNVKINDMIFITAPATVTEDPDAGRSRLDTEGLLQIMNGTAVETLFSAKSLPLELDGATGKITPTIYNPNFKYDFTLGGVPLVGVDSPIEVGDKDVTVTPTFFIGIPRIFTLAEAKATVVFPKGDWKQLRGLSLVSAKVLSAKVVSLDGTYTPSTGIFRLKGGVDFSFLKMPSATGEFNLWQDCFNGWDLGAGEVLDLANETGSVAAASFGMDHICDEKSFLIFITGKLVLKNVDVAYLSLDDVRLEYEHPSTFRLSSGEVVFLNYPATSVKGVLSLKKEAPGATFNWEIDLMGLLKGDMKVVLSLNRMMFMIDAQGAVTIPDFTCGITNIPCKVLRTAIRSWVTLPLTLNSEHVDGVIQRIQSGEWEGHLRGQVPVGPINACVQYDFKNGQWELLVGSNFQDMYVAGYAGRHSLDPLAEDKPVEIPAGRPLVLFAGSSETSIPAIHLQNPAGETITPENAGSFPGITYISDPAEKVAIFQVMNPAAGTWTLGQEGMPPEQVTLVALSPAPAPEVAFTSVQRSGNTVSMTATVTPAKAETKVGFLYAKNPDGLDAEWIDVDLPSGTGQVSATWDISAIETGTYYLLARADDGLNPSVTAFYPQPIVVDRGVVLAPTGLAGTRKDTEATLHWTPSATQGDLQYQVLYTDNPDVIGYPYLRSAMLLDEITIEGLDKEKSYRFCVVAYDEAGNCSPQSEPLTLKPGPSIPGDCDGNGTVSIGEVQKAINMFLGAAAADCGVDCDGNGQISIGELQKVINAFLGFASSCS